MYRKITLNGIIHSTANFEGGTSLNKVYPNVRIINKINKNLPYFTI